ncbi:MAG: outer membrane beta-barrel protein [Sulfurovum sp.]
MLRKIVVVCLSILVASSLNAREVSQNETFIGLEMGYVGVQGDRVLDPKHTDSDLSYGIRIGTQNEDWRAIFLYSYYNNVDSDQNAEFGLFSLDYFFLQKNSSTVSIFRPYLGLNIGYGNYESTNLANVNAYLYGGQTGVVVDINDNIDIDFSYRHSFSDEDAFNHVGGFIFGVNYIY